MNFDKLSRSEKGSHAENLILKKYKKNKYSLLDKNFKTRFGEIDLILQKKTAVVFVEVRSQKNEDFMSIYETIDKKKQHRIINTAKYYVQKNRLDDYYFRFDIACVNFSENKVEIYENAFTI